MIFAFSVAFLFSFSHVRFRASHSSRPSRFLPFYFPIDRLVREVGKEEVGEEEEEEEGKEKGRESNFVARKLVRRMEKNRGTGRLSYVNGKMAGQIA